MSRPRIFPFQLKLGVKECNFGLPCSHALLGAVIQLTLPMRIRPARYNAYIYMHPHIVGSMPFRFFLATLYRKCFIILQHPQIIKHLTYQVYLMKAI